MVGEQKTKACSGIIVWLMLGYAMLQNRLPEELRGPIQLFSQKKSREGRTMISRSMMMTQLLTKGCSGLVGLVLGYAMLRNRLPEELRDPIKRYSQRLVNFLNPYVHVTFPEHTGGDGFWRSSPAFFFIERYLNANSTSQAKNLLANVPRFVEDVTIVLSMAKNEEVTDEYEGIKLWWSCQQTTITPPDEQQSVSSRSFRLTFHRRHRHTMATKYLKHVIAQGRAITLKERNRKLYTNNSSKNNDGGKLWSHVAFQHPATFDTLAMDPVKKRDIINDLLRFTASKDYYAKIGKAWKRGYLLFGPPGTGKSTMIAAMANLLNYDVYDLELTAVKDNTELRKLLIDTSNKSIIVIEDIDCSLDLTGQRANNNNNKEKELKEKSSQKEKVTLSGLLNFIDGLWSSCGGERIIVFTTNYVEKLDPALIRRGRMDKHVELSFCGFEAFKVLAKNYLNIEDHGLFGTVKDMLEETEMTPADVAENLMPTLDGEDGESCLKRLIKALVEAKEQAARDKAHEEEKEEKLAKEEAAEKENEQSGGGDSPNPKTDHTQNNGPKKQPARIKAQEKNKAQKLAKEEEDADKKKKENEHSWWWW